MRNVLIDTNAYTAILNGDEALRDAVAHADTVAVSVIVLGELHAGFSGGSRRAENEEVLADFMEKPGVSVLLLSLETAEVFGEIKSGLRRAGSPIPVNDVWLAAQAVETGRMLLTLDAHFRRVPGLRLWNA